MHLENGMTDQRGYAVKQYAAEEPGGRNDFGWNGNKSREVYHFKT